MTCIDMLLCHGCWLFCSRVVLMRNRSVQLPQLQNHSYLPGLTEAAYGCNVRDKFGMSACQFIIWVRNKLCPVAWL